MRQAKSLVSCSEKLLVPMAAALMLLLGASVAMNFWYDNLVDRLTQEQANLTARVLNMAPNDTRLVRYVEESEVESYLMENPSNAPLMLMPPGDRRPSRRFALRRGRSPCRTVNRQHDLSGNAANVPSLAMEVRPEGAVEVNARGWGIMAM